MKDMFHQFRSGDVVVWNCPAYVFVDMPPFVIGAKTSLLEEGDVGIVISSFVVNHYLTMVTLLTKFGIRHGAEDDIVRCTEVF